MKGCVPVLFTIMSMVFALSATGQYALDGLDMDGDIGVWYDAQVGDRSLDVIHGVYEGIQRTTPYSHPFFGAFRWTAGSMMYRDQHYTDLLLMYNVRDDILILKHPNPDLINQQIRLNQSQVTEFEIGGKKFFNYGKKVSTMHTGLFEVLLFGIHLDVIVKRSKVPYTRSNNTSHSSFRENDQYFIRWKEEFIPLSGKRTFFQLLESHKSDLRKFARNNQLALRAGINDSQLVMFAAYCNQILEEE